MKDRSKSIKDSEDFSYQCLNSKDSENENRPIDKVFAFRFNSINTSYMAGYTLEPIEVTIPSIKSVFWKFIKSLFR